MGSGTLSVPTLEQYDARDSEPIRFSLGLHIKLMMQKTRMGPKKTRQSPSGIHLCPEPDGLDSVLKVKSSRTLQQQSGEFMEPTPLESRNTQRQREVMSTEPECVCPQ